MIRAWRAWIAVLQRREDALPLAIFRALTGLAVLWNLLPAVLHGVVRVIWLDRDDGGYRVLRAAGSWLVQAAGDLSPGLVWGLVISTLCAGFLVMIGVGGRVAALCALQGTLAISMINTDAKGSYDALLCNSLWLLCLGDGQATLSIAAKRRHGVWIPRVDVAAWPRYLVILQIAAVYFSTGIHKVSAFWTPMGGFSALYYILQQPTWHRFDMTWLAHVYPLTQVSTALVWIFELTWPLLGLALYLRQRPGDGRVRRLLRRFDPRTPYVIFGVSMHLMILAFMEVGPFSAITIAYYPCLYRADELRRGWARLRRRLRSAGAGEALATPEA
ncbi:MAG: HTTM domain-containing protein [Nannocystaceae bacterium]